MSFNDLTDIQWCLLIVSVLYVSIILALAAIYGWLKLKEYQYVRMDNR